MKRTLITTLALSLLAPAAALAQDGPRLSVFGSRDASVNGEVHKGATSAIANLGPLNPALAGVAAELRIESRSHDEIYGKASTFGVELAWPMAAGEVFAQVASTRAGEGQVQVGGAFVPALNTTLPVFGRFGDYKALALEGGYRHYLSTGGAFRPYLAGRLGATRVDDIEATFTIPAASIALNDVPFYKGGWGVSAGADVGVAWAFSETASLALEAGVRHHRDLDGDDSAIGGLGLAGINDTGARTAFPVGLRFQLRF